MNQLIWGKIPILRPTKPTKFWVTKDNKIVAWAEWKGASLQGLAKDQEFCPKPPSDIRLVQSVKHGDPVKPKYTQIIKFQLPDGATTAECIWTQAKREQKTQAKENTCIYNSDQQRAKFHRGHDKGNEVCKAYW